MCRLLILAFLTSTAHLYGTICLNMIVKNESRAIEQCLVSVKPLIDSWVIVDTGSTDGTQEIIRKVLKDVPGELHERPWVNFEHNRNEALGLAKNKAEYLLFLDADERLIYLDSFRHQAFNQDAYTVKVEQADGLSYERMLLVKSDLDWKWEGVVHEWIRCPAAKRIEFLPQVINFSDTSKGARSQDPQKYLRDAHILEQALAQDPTNSRYVFYLAQSYANAGQYPLALQRYQQRALMGGDEQQVFWSLYCTARLHDLSHAPSSVIVESFLAAFHYRPSRVEPLYRLIQHYLSTGDYLPAYLLSKEAIRIPMPLTDIYVEHSLYEYAVLFQFVQCAHRVGKYAEASQATEQLLANSRLPAAERAALEQQFLARR